MLNYLLRRLLLLPLTLFCIIVVNFTIVNLAPGDPVSITEVSEEGEASRREDGASAFGDDRYLQFREHYGLTLPVLFNNWPSIDELKVRQNLSILVNRRLPNSEEEMPVKEYNSLRVRVGDQARYTEGHLLSIMEDESVDPKVRTMAIKFFVRGGYRQAFLGPGISEKQKQWNRKIAKDNSFLRSQQVRDGDPLEPSVSRLRSWYDENKEAYRFEPSVGEKAKIFFLETRFCRYLGRVVTLDFGTMRNDSNKTVISEVVKRFKYSLTLAIIPMLVTFVLCQVFGFIMALKQNRWQDLTLNIAFLIMYAIPVFVVAPFLIEKIALHHTFPFTDTPIPFSGFTSSETIYSSLTSAERLADIGRHIFLPLVAIMYGGLASQSRLSRTAVLEVLRQDYVRTARAKGLGQFSVMFKHAGRNAAITIVTSIAGSLGIVLGGSLIVETLFDINGFGKFFYDAVLNRDYNVIMFSAIAGAFLSLVGYLVADIAYTLLDPRVTLD